MRKMVLPRVWTSLAIAVVVACGTLYGASVVGYKLGYKDGADAFEKESLTAKMKEAKSNGIAGAYLSVGYMAGTTLGECRDNTSPAPEAKKACDWAAKELAHQMKGTGVDQLGEVKAEK